MFINIEGGKFKEQKDLIDKERNETATRLWKISCCKENVFNKTNFDDA